MVEPSYGKERLQSDWFSSGVGFRTLEKGPFGMTTQTVPEDSHSVGIGVPLGVVIVDQPTIRSGEEGPLRTTRVRVPPYGCGFSDLSVPFSRVDGSNGTHL